MPLTRSLTQHTKADYTERGNLSNTREDFYRKAYVLCSTCSHHLFRRTEAPCHTRSSIVITIPPCGVASTMTGILLELIRASLREVSDCTKPLYNQHFPVPSIPVSKTEMCLYHSGLDLVMSVTPYKGHKIPRNASLECL